MHQSEIRKYAKDICRKAGSALHAFIKKGDQEKLHRFRTHVKKLRAIARLDELAAPHLYQSLRPLKKTYRLSGTIRERYLHLELGKAVAARPGFLTTQQQEMELAIARLRHQKNRHDRRLHRAQKQLIKGLRPVKGQSLSIFYEKELHNLAQQLHLSESDDGLHDCRKRLKILLYNLPFVRHALTLPVNETYLDKVQTAIGDWHDNLLAELSFPGLQRKTKHLRKIVKSLTSNFYEQVTTPTDLPLLQID
ncbi:MAG TPA: CHAD domain-containing protein [Mucilaginibacter sp.]|jgi:CHAD domain-containing protein|nr:CHAD domain-containing protein [Mucilaginibacter sp.]